MNYCKTMNMENKIPVYINKLQGFSLARHTRQVFNTETLFYRNKSDQLIFYDKLKELAEKYKKNNDFLSKDYKEKMKEFNVFRIEHRVQNVNKLKKMFGGKTRPSLWCVANGENELKKEFMKSYQSVTKQKNIKKEIAFYHDLGLLKKLRLDRRYPVNDFLQIEGLFSVMSRYNNDLVVIRELFDAAGFDRKYWSKLLSKITKYSDFIYNRNENDSKLMNELNMKVAA